MRMFLLSISFVLCGCATSHLPNFSQVEPGVYRGGQPDAMGWAELKAMGVTEDLKLNSVNEASDDGAIPNGIWLHYYPIDLYHQTLAEPSDWILNNAVNKIARGTYIHCSHGQDRTGLIVGLYRIWVEHWSKPKAYAEMRAHGFHPLLFGLSRAWDDQEPRDKTINLNPQGEKP
jgi:tyrosine-protein phosphatase SIW14